MASRIYLSLLFILIFSLFTACGQGDTVTRDYPDQVTSHQLGDPFEISKGEIAVIENGKISIKVDEFMEDSRCPLNAECIWAGQAKVRFNVNGELVVLTLGELIENDKNTFDLGNGLVLKLLDITPYPGSEEKNGQPSVRLVVVHS